MEKTMPQASGSHDDVVSGTNGYHVMLQGRKWACSGLVLTYISFCKEWSDLHVAEVADPNYT
jgi:hypothetical protein